MYKHVNRKIFAIKCRQKSNSTKLFIKYYRDYYLFRKYVEIFQYSFQVSIRFLKDMCLTIGGGSGGGDGGDGCAIGKRKPATSAIFPELFWNSLM